MIQTFWRLYAVNHFPNRTITLAKEHLSLAIRNSYLGDKGELPAIAKPLDLNDFYDTEELKPLMKNKAAKSWWLENCSMIAMLLSVSVLAGCFAISILTATNLDTKKIIFGSLLAVIAIIANVIACALTLRALINPKNNYLFRFFHHQHQKDI